MNPIEKPGWNDPPNFSYNQNLEYSKSPKRNILNKRIAFPMNVQSFKEQSSIDPTAAPCNKVNLSPPMSVNTNKPKENENNCNYSNRNKIMKINDESTSCDDEVSKNDNAENISDSEILDRVLNNLYHVMEKKSTFSENQIKNTQIKKKLQIMEEYWKANKFSSSIKSKIHELSIALKNDDTDTANQIQVALIVDYPKLCSEFITVFRQLINVE